MTQLATVVFASAEDLAEFVDPSLTPEDAAHRLIESGKTEHVVVTTKHFVALDTVEVQVSAHTSDGVATSRRVSVRELDPIGSGDALAAAYLDGMLRGLPPAERVELAAMTYCIKRTLVGDHVPISAEDLSTWIASDTRFVR